MRSRPLKNMVCLNANRNKTPFAVGASSTQRRLCYLKQVKQRNTAQVYGDDNVCLCRMQKTGNFLQFRFIGNSPEAEHLRTRNQFNREQFAQKAADLSARGLSQRQISRELNISLGYVNKLLKCCADVGECADEWMCRCVNM